MKKTNELVNIELEDEMRSFSTRRRVKSAVMNLRGVTITTVMTTEDRDVRLALTIHVLGRTDYGSDDSTVYVHREKVT